MSTLYLHIGSGKAGSTSLQVWLRENNLMLHERRIHYLKSFGNHNHVLLPCYSIENIDGNKTPLQKRYVREGIEEFRKRVEWNLCKELEERSQNEVFVASSENLALDVTKSADINRLAGFLSGFFEKIYLVVFLKRQDRFAVSQYNDAIKRFGNSSQNAFAYIRKSKFYT